MQDTTNQNNKKEFEEDNKEQFVEVKTRQVKSNTYNYIVAFLCFLWSVFQLYVAYFPLNTNISRSIHLAFAIGLVFLLNPVKFHKKAQTSMPFYDIVFCVVGIGVVLYPALDFYGLAERPGDYLVRDIVVAFIAMFILMEAGRRVIGPALGIICAIFLMYDYFGPYMPDVIAHQGASLEKLAGHMFLTTEGVFGVPIGVSVSFIYLFVLFGALLERAGAGQYFINLAFSLLGRFKGGPAKASVIASGLTGMVSGSSTANVVTVGTFTIPLMTKAGLTRTKAGAIEVAAGVNGQLMPPIMGAAAFIIAEFLGMSYTNVMMAAIIPAFACYISLFFIVHLESCKLGLRGIAQSEYHSRIKIFLSGIHYLTPIAMLLYTLLVLKGSPIAAAFNAIGFLFLIMIFQEPTKKLAMGQKVSIDDVLVGFSDIFLSMVSAAKSMTTIAVATGLAGIIVGSISLTGLGQVLSDIVEQLAGNNILLILLLTAVMSLVLGMGLPTTANYIVVSSLVAPVILLLAAKNGFLIPAIAVHLFVFYFGILADDTPPVGIAAYAAAGIAKANPVTVGLQGFFYDLRTAILPFSFFFNSKLMLIESVDPANPYDAKSIVWMSNPLEIMLVFGMAVVGMFAFSSILQGYFVTKMRFWERLLLVPVVPLALVPNVCARYSIIPNEYAGYAIGLGLYAFVFAVQWMKNKSDKTKEIA
ncbi:TRAP transporter permease [Campylobacter sp. faydin G-140]|uniref:TRAP transporter permease n=1 Tax=Campylobacter anatolicus TaxID=2829105 RepID=UPI001B95DDB3|nr:TRAP transporter permease [Campylobacter anatolicus]MBR8462058.1 TRAP transporter permease [Campylobacter anatolicus]MBR8464855.1 TRAP transporter permease [Campylobacter anatolicus]